MVIYNINYIYTVTQVSFILFITYFSSTWFLPNNGENKISYIVLLVYSLGL